MTSKKQSPTTILLVSATVALLWVSLDLRAETVRDRLWIWGRPAGIYNNTHFRPLGLRSTVEPVNGAEQMGIRNVTFIATENLKPLEEYYRPFERLDRVYWSLVAAGGGTSRAAREAAFALAEKHKNIVGFILDDFFHEPNAGNAADPGPDRAFRASLTPAELRAIRERPVRGARVPLMSVIYTAQVKPGARAHLAEVDQICLWTWRPEDLKNLEANFAALEKLAPEPMDPHPRRRSSPGRHQAGDCRVPITGRCWRSDGKGGKRVGSHLPRFDVSCDRSPAMPALKPTRDNRIHDHSRTASPANHGS